MKTVPSTNKHKKFVYTLLVCLFLLTPTRAQYYFDKWDTNGGLPQNTIGAITQTSDGYLWLATLDGLVRFDGVKFKVFTVGNSAGLSNNRFRLLHETPDEALWIGSEDFGVTRYKDGKFRTFTEKDGLPTDSPLAFATDSDDSLLVVTSLGLAKFDGTSFHLIESKFSPSLRTCKARGGGLWILDDGGLRSFKGGTIEKVELDSSLVEINFNPVCYEATDGSIWISQKDGQIFNTKTGRLVSFRAEIGSPERVLFYFINEDHDGNLWIGTDYGLLKFKNDRFERYSTEDGLSDKSIISFYEDRENSLWFGTFYGGLNRLSRRAISVLTTKDGLAGNGVYPIYEAKDGAIWVGAGGLTRIKDNQFTRFPGADDGMYGDVTAIAEDRDGNLWLGASGAVGFVRAGKFTDLKNKFVLKSGTYTVWAIHQDRAGAIWFGTSHGLVRKTGEIFEVFKTADGLPSDDIKIIHEDKNGRLWFGSYGGLSLWENSKFTNFTMRDGLSSNRVRALYEDENGTFWIGTYDGGLNRFKDGKFTNYSTKNGLFSDGVFQILPDREGFFWMSSNQGIYRVPVQELEDLAAGKIQAVTSEAFGKRDGLLNTECNGGRQPAGIRARNGRLWFPTQEGAAIVNPKTVEKNPLLPPVVIEGITIDQKQVELSNNLQILPNQVNLEIAYTGLSFVKPEQMRFRYKLEGLDEKWVEAGTRRTAYFSHLPPGDYTFRVTAANNSGVWNTKGTSIHFTVYPPFWQTWWFLLLSALTIAAILYIMFRQRINKLERDRKTHAVFAQNLIAAQERERKRIAGELHDGLGQNLLVIKNWALLSLQRNQGNKDSKLLEEISDTASQTIEEVRRIAYNLRPYQIDEIGLTRAIEGMLTRLKATTKIELSWQIDNIDGCFAAENEINLFRIVQECGNNIIKHSAATEARVMITHDANSVLLRIEDNGKGFVPESLNGKRGLGLTGIEERARMINGAAQIHSALDKGTIIQINIYL